MERYKNLGGNSGVSHYQINDTNIKVRFGTVKTYVYSYLKPGQMHVEQMKRLAISGRGLQTYINQHVKYAYASIE